eukprot:scaffold11998_cov174-Amphora_coffeaeformis.AAC.14
MDDGVYIDVRGGCHRRTPCPDCGRNSKKNARMSASMKRIIHGCTLPTVAKRDTEKQAAKNLPQPTRTVAAVKGRPCEANVCGTSRSALWSMVPYLAYLLAASC